MSLLEGNSTKTNKMKETEVAQMQINVNAHMKIKLSSTTVRPKITLDKISLVFLNFFGQLKKNFFSLENFNTWNFSTRRIG